MNWQRASAMAGTFYPDHPDALNAQLDEFLRNPQPKHTIAMMAPHAGYAYSGGIAGEVYRKVTIPDHVIILCPNHTGLGDRFSVWSKGSWETPLGNIEVDEDLAQVFLKEFDVEPDQEAHLEEHAIEVQLPFIQRLNPKAKFVPITLGPHLLPDCLHIGDQLAKIAQDSNALLISSTDMSHFITAEEAKERDAFALDAIARMNPKQLFQVVREKDISMCGFIPTTAVMAAAIKLGAKDAEILAYGTSGDMTGDFDSVVGYAAAKFS